MKRHRHRKRKNPNLLFNHRRRRSSSSTITSLLIIVVRVVVATTTVVIIIHYILFKFKLPKYHVTTATTTTTTTTNVDVVNKTSSSQQLNPQQLHQLLQKEITLSELQSARTNLLQAKKQQQQQQQQQSQTSHESPTTTPWTTTRPLVKPLDQQKYTIRINTWRRNDQLITSVHHFLTCPGVHQIQIIWCDDVKVHPPPKEILELTTSTTTTTNQSRVVIEYHFINSLNERFHILHRPETLGILSIDDDVLRPCEAVDDGFFRWVDHPDRMVGFDYRMHVVSSSSSSSSSDHSNTNKSNNNKHKHLRNTKTTPPSNPRTTPLLLNQNEKWTYGYLSNSQTQNQYSLSLTRFCFLHVDYFDLYMTYMPKPILQIIDQTFNCEDIAMSFFVSSLTNGQVPLLANHWSLTSLVKLSSSSSSNKDHGGNNEEEGGGGGISHSAQHKVIRDKCVDLFGYLLGLKDGYEELLSIEKEEEMNTNRNRNGHSDEHQPSEKQTQQWKKLENQKIWQSNHKRNVAFGIGVDMDTHPLHMKSDYVGRRKEFVLMLREWAKGNGSFFTLQQRLRRKVDRLGLLGD